MRILLHRRSLPNISSPLKKSIRSAAGSCDRITALRSLSESPDSTRSRASSSVTMSRPRLRSNFSNGLLDDLPGVFFRASDDSAKYLRVDPRATISHQIEPKDSHPPERVRFTERRIPGGFGGYTSGTYWRHSGLFSKRLIFAPQTWFPSQRTFRCLNPLPPPSGSVVPTVPLPVPVPYTRLPNPGSQVAHTPPQPPFCSTGP